MHPGGAFAPSPSLGAILDDAPLGAVDVDSSTLTEGQFLSKGGYLINSGRSAVLVFQNDGNLVLYRGDGLVLWATNTQGQPTSRATAVKGNFVLTKTDGTIAWSSTWDADWKWGNGSVILQEDGDLVMRSGTTNTWNTKTYGLVPKSSNDHSGWRPLHVLDDPLGVVGDAVHMIPGVDWLGTELKKFAQSPLGFAFLDIIAGTIMQAGAMGLTNLGQASTQYVAGSMATSIASIAFAFPGLLAGDDFADAYLKDLANRAKQVAEYLIGSGVADAAAAEAAAEIAPAIKDVTDEFMHNSALSDLAKNTGVDVSDLTAKLQALGLKNVTDYVSQKARDLLNHVNSIGQNAVDGFTMGGVSIPGVPAKSGFDFDLATGKLKRPAARQMSVVQVQQAAANAKRAGTQMSTAQVQQSAAVAKRAVGQMSARSSTVPSVSASSARRQILGGSPAAPVPSAAPPMPHPSAVAVAKVIAPTPVSPAVVVGGGLSFAVLAYAIVRFL